MCQHVGPQQPCCFIPCADDRLICPAADQVSMAGNGLQLTAVRPSRFKFYADDNCCNVAEVLLHAWLKLLGLPSGACHLAEALLSKHCSGKGLQLPQRIQQELASLVPMQVAEVSSCQTKACFASLLFKCCKQFISHVSELLLLLWCCIASCIPASCIPHSCVSPACIHQLCLFTCEHSIAVCMLISSSFLFWSCRHPAFGLLHQATLRWLGRMT